MSTSLMYPAVLHAALLAGGAAPVLLQDAVAVQEAPVDDHETPLQRARALATSGDPAQREQAIAMYGEMLQASAGNSDVLLARGRTFAWMGRHAEAEADLAVRLQRRRRRVLPPERPVGVGVEQPEVKPQTTAR